MNLPLDGSQLGVDSYRGVHPRSLKMVEEFFESVLGQQIRIKNPFLFNTKAEMCSTLLPTGLANAVQHTVSCDSFPLRIHNRPSQCGCCTSCVLRRQALKVCGLADHDVPKAYRFDLFGSQEKLKGSQLEGWRLMSSQVYKLTQCLSSDSPWISLTSEFPELARTSAELSSTQELRDVDVISGFLQLFKNYVMEWQLLTPHLNLAA